jgi:predicted  nucleic acid-binding Zn-ribbon protein
MILQEIDTQLQRLEALKGDLPNQVRRLNQELAEGEKSLVDQEQKLMDCRKEVGANDLDMKSSEGKLKKYQNQLFEVKTNREYDAVTHEIESVKTEIGKKESHQLELMEWVDSTQKIVEELKVSMERLRQEFEKKKADLQKKQEATEREELELKDKRDKALKGIDPKRLASYERIRRAKNGLAMVPVAKNACGGCRKKLPPQRVLEIREGDRLFLCDVCGRMLVWDEQISEQTE